MLPLSKHTPPLQRVGICRPDKLPKTTGATQLGGRMSAGAGIWVLRVTCKSKNQSFIIRSKERRRSQRKRRRREDKPSTCKMCTYLSPECLCHTQVEGRDWCPEPDRCFASPLGCLSKVSETQRTKFLSFDSGEGILLPESKILGTLSWRTWLSSGSPIKDFLPHLHLVWNG